LFLGLFAFVAACGSGATPHDAGTADAGTPPGDDVDPGGDFPKVPTAGIPGAADAGAPPTPDPAPRATSPRDGGLAESGDAGRAPFALPAACTLFTPEIAARLSTLPLTSRQEIAKSSGERTCRYARADGLEVEAVFRAPPRRGACTPTEITVGGLGSLACFRITGRSEWLDVRTAAYEFRLKGDTLARDFVDVARDVLGRMDVLSRVGE
jgi:hypothetical protein